MPRARSLEGCFTCRARKVRCDETRPICKKCSNADLHCDGFEARLRWLHYLPTLNEFQGEASGPSVDDGGHGRRFLYTDAQRQSMSRFTAISVGRDEQRLSQMLIDLDAETAGDDNIKVFAYGPFRAYRLEAARPNNGGGGTNTELNVQPESISSEEIAEITRQNSWSEEADQALESWDFTTVVDDDQLLNSYALQDQFSSLNAAPREADWTQNAMNFPLIQSVPNTPITPDDFNPNLVPSSAHHLLRVYRENMGNWFSPLRSRKPPWGVLHLPIALSTVSELIIWGKASHARITVFRALLAVSAFTLGDTTSTYWREIGVANRFVAQLEMKQCLMKELSGPSKAKYKDTLLALLSLVSISVASGQFRDVRAYLGDAEKLICMRGIPKRFKSRKTRILHYIFLFLRVVEESTYIYPEGENCQRLGTDELNKDDLLFPSIQTQVPQIGQRFSRVEFELGLLSIVPNSPSLLMEIYGIPLSLFSLISRATSLANALDLEAPVEADRLRDPERARQIKKLENEICTWNIEDATIVETGAVEEAVDASPANGGRTQHLILALHNALMLYFYRRIYNVNPWLLQSFVDKVLEHLQMVEQEKLEFNILNTSIVWPGFIAAAEACGEESRRISLAWLKGNWRRSGWRSFEQAAIIAEELWATRQSGNHDITWVDLLKGRGTTLVLT